MVYNTLKDALDNVYLKSRNKNHLTIKTIRKSAVITTIIQAAPPFCLLIITLTQDVVAVVKVKLSLCLISLSIWGSRGIAPPFLPSALDGGEWSASRPCRFTPGERAPGTHWIGGWVGPGAGLDAEDKRKIVHCPKSNPGRPARSPSLYRLSYPDSVLAVTDVIDNR
jgi:hypothetical protein